MNKPAPTPKKKPRLRISVDELAHELGTEVPSPYENEPFRTWPPDAKWAWRRVARRAMRLLRP